MEIKIGGRNVKIFKLIGKPNKGLSYEKLTTLKENHGYKWSPKAPTRLLNECFLESRTLDEEGFRCLDYLLSIGADINNYHRGSKATPLILAISENHLEGLEYLLEKGANPNADTPAGPAILYAAGKDSTMVFFPCKEKDDALELLLKYGADPTLKLGNTQSASYWAKRTGNKSAMLILKKVLGESVKLTAAERASQARETYDGAQLSSLSEDKSTAVRRAVAANRQTPLEALEKLLKEDDEKISRSALSNYFYRSKDKSLEDIFDPKVVHAWYAKVEAKKHRYPNHEELEFFRANFAARHSSNEDLHWDIIEVLKKTTRKESEAMHDLYSTMAENPWLGLAVRRALIFDVLEIYPALSRRAMTGVKDKNLIEDYIARDDLCPGDRFWAEERFNKLFG